MTQSSTFSVLICTFNRHELLRRTLGALIEQTIEKPNEIIVVNAGDERADQVVGEFARRCGVRVHLTKTVNRGPAANRNHGLHLCIGDIVAITDDDAEVSPDWVTQMKRIHAGHPEAGAVGGKIIGITSNENFVSQLFDTAYFPSWTEPTYVTTLPTVNISYKRDVLEKLGPFDENLVMGEDVDYNWRVQQLGYRIFYHPAIQVRHHNPSSLFSFWRRYYTAGRYYHQVRRKWPEMYCVYPQGLHRPKDVLKYLNFCISILYEPFLAANRLERFSDKVRAVPVLMVTQALWKTGMIVQMLQNLFT